MKRIVRRLGCLLVMVMLSAAFLSMTASAGLNDGKVGQPFKWCIWQTQGDNPGTRFSGVTVTDNTCPGMTLQFQSDAVFLSGTPGSAGTHTLSYIAYFEDGGFETDSVTFTVAPADPHPEYISCSATFTVGTAGSVTTADCSNAIQSCTMSSGSLPTGMSYSSYDSYLQISGTPTAPGSYSAVFYCGTEGEPVYFTVNITVNPAPVLTARKVTQHPADVTVEAGSDCQFSANADGKGWCAWRFYKPDGSEVIFDRLKSLGSPYDQVALEGGNSLTFRMKNVPAEMDGWTVCCLFALSDSTDYGKPWSYSNRAKLTVTVPAPPEPPPEPTPEPPPAPPPPPTPAPTP
ncbi:MAG: hypothetical protein KBS46_00500, partial [Clostridiales bacterium]|nr:hypothetical protein [Candidatus Apopatocola equi]